MVRRSPEQRLIAAVRLDVIHVGRCDRTAAPPAFAVLGTRAAAPHPAERECAQPMLAVVLPFDPIAALVCSAALPVCCLLRLLPVELTLPAVGQLAAAGLGAR